MSGVLCASLLLVAGRQAWHAPRQFAVPRTAAGPRGPTGWGAAISSSAPRGSRWFLEAADNADAQRQGSSLLGYGRAVWTSIYTALWGPTSRPKEEESDLASSSGVLESLRAGLGDPLLGYGRAVWTSIYTALWGPPSRPEEEESDEASSSGVLESLRASLGDLHAKLDSVNATIMGAVKDAQSGVAEMSSQIGSNLGSLPEPKDLYLFMKNYDWGLRYRVRRVAADLDVDSPLELMWVKLRKAPTEPAEVLRDTAISDLFDWTETAPVRHKGFMYEVTKAVGSGVEAVLNLQGRVFNLIVNLDGISMAPSEATAQPRRVTHCWVDVAGLPFFPSVRAINFFNSQESVLAWQA